MDLGRKISEQVRRTIIDAMKDAPHNIAAAANINRDGGSVRVYSADDVTIVQRNGKTTIIRQDEGAGDGDDSKPPSPG
jgi:hypothetical protein